MKKSIIRWLPAILICSFIFSQSLKTGSESSGTSLVLTQWLSTFLFFIEENTLHFLVRKAAHFSEFFLLGCSILYGMNQNKNIRLYIVMCLFIPLCDEGIQVFVPGRSAQLGDCLIDASSMLTAWFLHQTLKGGTHHEHMES